MKQLTAVEAARMRKDAAWARVYGLIDSLPYWRTAQQERELRRAGDEAEIASMKYESAKYESR